MVEIIPKEAPKISQWKNILFYFSLALLIFSVVSYFILDNSLREHQEKMVELKLALVEQVTPEKNILEKEILDYQKKIEDFSQLIRQNLKTSEIFTIIQKNSHPKTWFQQFNLDAKQAQVTLSGQTQSFESLGQQLLIFREEDVVKSANLGGISISQEGRIGFDFSLSLDPKIFK